MRKLTRILKRLAKSTRTGPVTEMASEVREGLENLADAVRTLAGVFASVAAAAHTRDLPSQRDMASVIYADAQSRFGDIIKRLDPKMQDELGKYIAGLCRGKR